jgi:antirestriction protein ArdC
MMRDLSPSERATQAYQPFRHCAGISEGPGTDFVRRTLDGFRSQKMDPHPELRDWSEACLHEAEACITHQQRLAESLEALGHKRQARQAREMLATFVKSYLLMHECHQTMENQSFSALAKAWLTFAVELENPQTFLNALGSVADSSIEGDAFR